MEDSNHTSDPAARAPNRAYDMREAARRLREAADRLDRAEPGAIDVGSTLEHAMFLIGSAVNLMVDHEL